MEPSVVVDGARVFLGDCREVLKTLPENSVDSVVTDPPYELGFMGKKWDSSGIAYDVTVWEECLRVLKPGGHILAFGGTRTWHRLAVAVEDAGFEIRDNIAWMYASGFPKSLDVSKAIDKNNGESGRVLKFVRWMQKTGLKAREIDNALKTAGLISPTSNRAVHYFNEGQPNIPTAEFWKVVRPLCGDVPAWVDELVARVEAEREVIGQTKGVKSPGFAGDRYSVNGGDTVEVATTLPATPEAQKWQGWGTALKPAFEPVVVGRKPIQGTVASNVLEQ
jgi:site-specific DNA-methyltransferase (adenine-specific)